MKKKKKYEIEEEDVDGKPFFSTILPLVIRGKKLEALYSINYAKGKFGNVSASRRAKKYYEELLEIRDKIRRWS